MVFTGECVEVPPMQRIEAIRHMAQVATKDDLPTTSIGQTWDDWWNHKPADNTFFTGILGSVTTTALGLRSRCRIGASSPSRATGRSCSTPASCARSERSGHRISPWSSWTTASTKISAGRRPIPRPTPISPRWRRAPVASIASPSAGRTSSTGGCCACSATIRWATQDRALGEA